MRNKRQKEFAECYLKSSGKGILYLCPRFGKCRVAINIFKTLKKGSKILIAYPDNKIKESWLEEMKICKWKGDVTYTTHLSLHKYEDNSYDMVVIDECHLLSERQIEVCQGIVSSNDRVLGLTGTMTEFTERSLRNELGLPVLARYPIDKAIEEGVVTDYEIRVVTVPLDNKVKAFPYKGKLWTEKDLFSKYTKVIDWMESKGLESFYMRLARMRIIQNSISKREATKKLLSELAEERVLVFCGVTKVADDLGCPVYHSKKGEKEVFENFAQGKGNHMAVVKIGNTGTTYKPLDKVIINYFDSNGENLAQKINRCMAMEYDTPDKKSIVYIVTTNEEVERKWLKRALEFFDKTKVKYI